MSIKRQRVILVTGRRHTRAAQHSSRYAEQLRTTLSIPEKDERGGIAPIRVAQLLEKIITARHRAAFTPSARPSRFSP